MKLEMKADECRKAAAAVAHAIRVRVNAVDSEHRETEEDVAAMMEVTVAAMAGTARNLAMRTTKRRADKVMRKQQQVR